MPESLTRCREGHYYDPTKQSTCPWCAPSGVSAPSVTPGGPPAPPPLPVPTQAAPEAAPVVAPPPPPPPQAATPPPPPPPVEIPLPPPIKAVEPPPLIPAPPPQIEPGPPSIPPENIKTVNHVNPVVGWLVCMEGPDKGQDFRLHAERNWIGRSPLMDVCVANDMTISREKHAAILFDPKRSSFWLTPGHASGLVYLNGEVVHGPQQMKADDLMEMGQTKLLLIPFCNAKRTWEKTPDLGGPLT